MAERHTLSLVESAKLVNLILAEYAASRKTDAEFATYAAEKLGFKVDKTHVNTRRVELAISASNKVVAPDLLAISERLEAVERQLAADQREFKGLAALTIDLTTRLGVLEKAARLKGTFEVPHG